MLEQDLHFTEKNQNQLPQEPFFLYWKVASSLWKTRLAQFHKNGRVFVPINWAYHAETSEQSDFGENRPENNLKKLYSIGSELGIQVVFLVQLTPLPFIVNGGVPAWLARNLALNDLHMGQAIVDRWGDLNKIYSFFDPRVYNGYRKFLWSLSQYFSQEGLDAEIFGLEGFYLQRGEYHSYLKDNSGIYLQSFSRFIQSRQTKIEQPASVLHIEFQNMIRDLYLSTCKEILSPNWAGQARFFFMGGSPEDVFYRITNEWEDKANLFEQTIEALKVGLLPAITLIEEEKLKGLKTYFFNKIIPDPLQTELDGDTIFEESLGQRFSSLSFFRILNQGSIVQTKKFWQDQGFFTQLEKSYPSLERYENELDKVSSEENESSAVLMANGFELDSKKLNMVFRRFLNGGKIILATSQLADDVRRKLDLFIMENNLKNESLRLGTQVNICSLGEGLLILFDDRELASESLGKKTVLWERIFGLLEFEHLKMQLPEQIVSYWQHRLPNPSELNYQEVRRLLLFNPSSYKLKFSITPNKKFAFLRYVDNLNSQLHHQQMSIDVEILPQGSIAMDFGYYE